MAADRVALSAQSPRCDESIALPLRSALKLEAIPANRFVSLAIRSTWTGTTTGTNRREIGLEDRLG